MKFAIGDKVSFLNEKLDGKIHSIINPSLVKVETNDGFVIDALATELVLVRRDEEASKANVKPIEGVGAASKNKTAFVEHANTIQFISNPLEENKLMTGAIGFYIYNCTDYELLFTLFEQQHKQRIFKTKGSITGNSYLQVCSYSREELMEVSNFTLQILFAGEGTAYMHPLVKDVAVVLPSFTNTVTAKHELKAQFATYTEVINLNPPTGEEFIVLKDKLQNVFESPLQKARQNQRHKLSEKQLKDQGILQNTAEVDLHIEELTSDFSHMSNTEMMALQLKKFETEMNKAIKGNYYNIVFIHGVGNGKLKQAIYSELKNYAGIKFRDADYARYGRGATEVIF